MYSHFILIFSSLSLIHGFKPINNIFRFSSYDDIQETINYIASVRYNVNLETIGHSLENRDINVVKINPGHRRAYQKIYIQAGIHAREWITPASALYLINKLSIFMAVCKSYNMSSRNVRGTKTNPQAPKSRYRFSYLARNTYKLY